MTDTDARTEPVAVGLIGAGAIGAFHGETLARRLPGARLAGVADPPPARPSGSPARSARPRPPRTRPSCWPTRRWRRS
jgi:predicted homoserine dehydrogenase-like protein